MADIIMIPNRTGFNTRELPTHTNDVMEQQLAQIREELSSWQKTLKRLSATHAELEQEETGNCKEIEEIEDEFDATVQSSNIFETGTEKHKIFESHLANLRRISESHRDIRQRKWDSSKARHNNTCKRLGLLYGLLDLLQGAYKELSAAHEEFGQEEAANLRGEADMSEEYLARRQRFNVDVEELSRMVTGPSSLFPSNDSLTV